jgi:hypothetical protein
MCVHLRLSGAPNSIFADLMGITALIISNVVTYQAKLDPNNQKRKGSAPKLGFAECRIINAPAKFSGKNLIKKFILRKRNFFLLIFTIRRFNARFPSCLPAGMP